MKKTLHIDDQLRRQAKEACGAATDTETVRLGLEALIRHAAYERLRAPAREFFPQTQACLMVLVDTSVWIRALANLRPWTRELDRLLNLDQMTAQRGRRLQGRGVAWIDIHLLASAVAGQLQFRAADMRRATLAAELGIAYPAPA